MKTRHYQQVLACLIAFWAVFVVGCSSKTEQPDPNKSQAPAGITSDQNDAQPTQPGQAAQSDKNDVAVTVNGVEITEGQIEALIEPMLKRIMARGQQLPPQFLQQYRGQLRGSALDRMIVDVLLDAEVKKSNMTVSDDEVMQQITEIASKQQPPMSLEQFQAALAQAGQDFNQVKDEISKGLLYSKVVKAQWAGKGDATEAEAKSHFEENKADYSTPEQVRASHILIPPDPNGDPNEAKKEALAKIQDLLKQVKEGADFAELAKANSTCRSSMDGGDLNFFGRKAMAKPFEDVAFALKIGEISDVVETQYGYHIIKVTDRKDATDPTFEDVKDKIIAELTQQKQMAMAGEYMDSLKAKATIVYPPGKEPAPAQPAFPGAVQ